MGRRLRNLTRLAGVTIFFIAMLALVWMLSLGFQSDRRSARISSTGDGLPPTPVASASASPLATPLSTPPSPPAAGSSPPPPIDQPEATPSPASPPPILPEEATRLIIPVAGVRPDQLRDTYNEARSEGRVHNAIDIPAPRGTPVAAATEGTIVKLFHSERGGITIYQLGPDQKTVYYYAHLDHYADGLAEGRKVRQGEVIGYVGDTGNAGAGNYHLHFAIWLISDPKHYWDGINLNPYPLLRHAP